jgi:hypothetical protein
MTEEDIEDLKENLRVYALSYDWVGQRGYNCVKKMFADNKKKWIKILQEEYNNRPWWLYKADNISIFVKFMCILSKLFRFCRSDKFIKDYLYDVDENLSENLKNIKNLEHFRLRIIDYTVLVQGYDSIHDYEFIACYVFNKVEQHNKLKLIIDG